VLGTLYGEKGKASDGKNIVDISPSLCYTDIGERRSEGVLLLCSPQVTVSTDHALLSVCPLKVAHCWVTFLHTKTNPQRS